MKLTNKTHWRTDQLKKLVVEVARRELLNSGFTKRLQVTVKYKRASYRSMGYGGYAWYNSHSMVLKLPRIGPVDSARVAKIIAHELAHCQGVKHNCMHNTRYGWVEGWRQIWGWAAAHPIEGKSATVKIPSSPLNQILSKIAECKKRMAAWQRKAKLAKTYLSKHARRLRYYETKAATISHPTDSQQSVAAPGYPQLLPPEAAAERPQPPAPDPALQREWQCG